MSNRSMRDGRNEHSFLLQNRSARSAASTGNQMGGINKYWSKLRLTEESVSITIIGKTVVAIAHRLSTISGMDRIIVLENGSIVEEGQHEDLLAKGGTYANYWNRQSGGFDQDRDAAE